VPEQDPSFSFGGVFVVSYLQFHHSLLTRAFGLQNLGGRVITAPSGINSIGRSNTFAEISMSEQTTRVGPRTEPRSPADKSTRSHTNQAKTGATPSEVRQAVKDAGNSRKKVEEKLGKK
jgi:hypothetical protein